MNKYSRLYRKNEYLTAYGMLLPSFIGIILFSILPITLSIINSFYNYGFYEDKNFVGWLNYANVLRDKNFRRAIFVGLKFTLYVVPLSMLFTFLFANVLKGLKGRFAGFVKTSIFIPTVVSSVIASLIFVYMYDYQAGLLNSILKLFGVPPQAWFQDTKLAMLSLTFPRIWLGFGYGTLLMLGGLLDIPEVYYEAAKIDGAGVIRRMISITLPCMKNMLLFILVSNFIGAMQEFDLPYNMTRGGPANATLTPSLFIYNHFIGDPTVGYSISAALLIAVVLGSLSALMFKLVNSEKMTD